MKFASDKTRGGFLARAALLVLLTLAVYVPAMTAGYIWDDDTLLTENPQMRSVAGLAQIWRGENSRDYTPVTLTAFWLEWRAWGGAGNAMGYHLVNILLHAGSAVLLWMILRALRVRWAWLGALLSAIHPVNVASVAWIAELKNTLAMVFFLGAVLCYLRWREAKTRKVFYWAALGLFLLAGLSKGAVIGLPVVLVICVLWKERKVTGKDWVELAPFVGVAGVVALLTILFQERAQHYGLLPDGWGYRIARAGMAVWYYLEGIFWPVGVSPMREPWMADPGAVMSYLPLAGVIAVMAILFLKRRSWGRGPLYAMSYYLVMLLPVLGLVWMTLMQETAAADWWQYFAAPGIFALVAAGVGKIPGRLLPGVICGLIVTAMMVQTWNRAGYYHSMGTYSWAVTSENPRAYTLENNLGIIYKRAGQFAKAEACFAQALAANPRYVEAHVNLANAYSASYNFGAAEWELRTALEMREGDPRILQNLASLLEYEGRGAEAENLSRPVQAGH